MFATCRFSYVLHYLNYFLQDRKSIGAEVNWGVRFLVPDDVSILHIPLHCSRILSYLHGTGIGFCVSNFVECLVLIRKGTS